jgi:hypothetical protein
MDFYLILTNKDYIYRNILLISDGPLYFYLCAE